jgi:type IV pilus assembly protein PilA
MNQTREGNQNKGFTLIELLIVVVIIGVLAAIAIPKFSAVREQAYRSAIMSDLRNIAYHQEIYHNGNYTFLTDLDALGAQLSRGVTVTVTEATTSGWAAYGRHEGTDATYFCGVFHGSATPTGTNPATAESVVECNF